MRARRHQRALCSRSRAADGGCEETAGLGGQEAAGESWAQSCCHGRVTGTGHPEGTPPHGTGAPRGASSAGPSCRRPSPWHLLGKPPPRPQVPLGGGRRPIPVAPERPVSIPLKSGCPQVPIPTTSRRREGILPTVPGIPVCPTLPCCRARSASAICWQCSHSHQVRASPPPPSTPPAHGTHGVSSVGLFAHCEARRSLLLCSAVVCYGLGERSGSGGARHPAPINIRASWHPSTPVPQCPSIPEPNTGAL